MGIRVSQVKPGQVIEIPPQLNEFVGDMEILEVADAESFDEGMVVASVTEPLECPKCGSEFVDFKSPEFIDADLIGEEAYCNDCEFKWHNYYTARYAESIFFVIK